MNLAELSAPPPAMRPAPEMAIKYRLRDVPPGWSIVPGYPTWQVVPNAEHPWDPDVVRAMREVDPQLVPLWVTWAYRPPQDDAASEVFVTGRHAMGWHMPNHASQDFQVLMPTSPIGGMIFKRPTRLWKVYHIAEETQDRIGGFVPFSWWMYYNLLDEFRPAGATMMKERNREAQKVAAVRKASIEAEQAYIQAQVSPFIQKKLDNVSDALWKEWLSGGHRTVKSQKASITLPGAAYPRP